MGEANPARNWPQPPKPAYKPGRLAMASTLVGGGGFLANVVFADSKGADISQFACAQLFAGLMLLPLPLLAGHTAFTFATRPQRAGEWAFAAVMVLQGVILIYLGWAAPKVERRYHDEPLVGPRVESLNTVRRPATSPNPATTRSGGS